MKSKYLISMLMMSAVLSVTGCTRNTVPSSSVPPVSEEIPNPDENEIDYLVLVNRQKEVPADWADQAEFVTLKNSMGDEISLEKKTADAFAELKDDLAQNHVNVDIYSGYRSVEEQQAVADDYTERYGEEYVRLNVAAPGYSEHHTGLALDLYLIVDGEAVYENEEMLEYSDLWAKVHARLAEHGFILHYLEGKEDITGFNYEPWHIRYVGQASAREIMEQGITLEEYLGEASSVDVEIDYGTSEIYTKDDMDEAITQIRKVFADFAGCELHNIRYTSDDCNSEENIKWMNELREDQEYTECIKFLSDFHTPAENSGAFEPDHEYTDYEWYLARSEGSSWEVLSYGY